MRSNLRGRGLAVLRVVDRHVHQPAGIRVGKRRDQDIFDNAEDRSGGSDAEGQGDDGDGRKGAALPECADGVTQILQDHFHDGWSPRSTLRAWHARARKYAE